VGGKAERVFAARPDLLPATPETRMDALSHVLRAVELSGAVFLDAEFRDPWCILVRGLLLRQLVPSAEHLISYHYIAEGRCQTKVDGEALDLEAGDVVAFPHGDPHVMGSALQLAPVPMAEVLRTLKRGELRFVRHGGAGQATRVVCGFLACDPRLLHPVLSALPRAFKVSLRSGPSGEWLERSIRQSVVEASSTRAGNDVVLAKLSEVLFVETLRRYIESLPARQTGWLAGLRDALVADALKLLHERSAERWTVEKLAREVGCSRSVLAERFTHYLGQPPMHYLAKWRLAMAARVLRAGKTRPGRIAAEVGYDSETAFNRAFKREYGMPPNRWRSKRNADG
jgi:AraC family transcriptional regulator, alkane utilization regulator